VHLRWTEEDYGTGFAEIDAQHQELFDRINRLLDACDAGRPEREVDLLLGFLSTYVVKHFVCEERLMAKHKCTGCKANRDGHRWFVGRFGELQADYRARGVDDALIADLRELLLNWVDQHVRQVDRSLAEVGTASGGG